MPYRLDLLGRVQLLHDGRPVESLAGHRQKLALVAYLALQPALRASRERLVSLFWPDRDESSARHSLSELVYELRKEACDLVETSRATVGLAADAFSCDVREFREAAESGDLGRALTLYSGHLLEGLNTSVSPEFEHWAEAERAQLHRLHRKVCRECVASLRDRGRVEEAIVAVRRWLQSDPFEDEAHHGLIELLFVAGDRGGALEQFDRYVKLCQEMEVEPLDETRQLVERVRAGAPAAVREETVQDSTYDRASRSGSLDVHPGRPGALVFDRPPRGWKPFVRELMRRHVLEVVALYLVVVILGFRATATLRDRLAWPDGAVYALYALLVIAFPAVVALAWAAGRTGAEPGRGGLVVSRLLPGLRWLAAVRSTHLMGLLGFAVIGLLGTLLLLPPVRPVAAPALDPTRIAVLYFDDHSEGQELGYLAAGLTEALIHELAQVEALTVISNNGVKPYRDSNLPVDSIARALEAGSLVEGSVARSGDRLRMSVRLIDGRGGAMLESRTLERPLGELFALQDDLASEVSGFLRRRLGLEIRLREGRRETKSEEAWSLVQRAERALEDYRPLFRVGDTAAASRVLHGADSLLGLAESLDRSWAEPTILRGWVAERQAALWSATPGILDEEWARRALAHAERAHAIDARNPRALELRGMLRYGLSQRIAGSEGAGMLDLAERDLRAAVAANPSLASAWATLSELLHLARGQSAEAKQAALRAWEEDAFLSDAADIIFRLCNTSLDLKEYDDAMRWALEGRRRFPDRVDFIAAELGVRVTDRSRPPDVEGAWELFDQIAEMIPPQRQAFFLPIAEMQVAAVLARAGLTDSARALIFRARERAGVEEQNWLAYDEAYVWLLLGDRERALRALRVYLEAAPHRRPYVAKDPWFEDLASDPEFRALVGLDG